MCEDCMRRLFVVPAVFTCLVAGPLCAQTTPAPVPPAPANGKPPAASSAPVADTVAARIDGETIMRSEVVSFRWMLFIRSFWSA